MLIADDDAVTRRLLQRHLRDAGYRTVLAADGEEALRKMTPAVAVALLDLRMPKISGMECLAKIRERFPEVSVTMISQHAEVRDAVEAMKQGAREYIIKPVDPEELLAHVGQAVVSSRLVRENRQLRQAVSSPTLPSPFLAESPAALAIASQTARIAELDSTVLITGESGTGKTTIARTIHHGGPRAKQPFIDVSCATLPRDLIESELFGHVRGAFTGAVSDRLGRAEMADGGTLFLDEIGDLPLELQPKLLTFLQDRKVQPIGAMSSRTVDVRVIAATHQDLQRKCRERSFREDLFFRLNVLPLAIPPLRERREDIAQFAAYVLERIAEKRGCAPYLLTDEARRLLIHHPWPGNIRELENVLERASAFCVEGVIGPDDLGLAGDPEPADSVSANGSLAGLTFAEIERRAILDALAHSGGNKKAAARQLGIDEKTIHNKIKRLGLVDAV